MAERAQKQNFEVDMATGSAGIHMMMPAWQVVTGPRCKATAWTMHSHQLSNEFGRNCCLVGFPANARSPLDRIKIKSTIKPPMAPATHHQTTSFNPVPAKLRGKNALHDA